MLQYGKLHKLLSLCLVICMVLSLVGTVSAEEETVYVYEDNLYDSSAAFMSAEKPDRDDIPEIMDYIYNAILNFEDQIDLTEFQLSPSDAMYCGRNVLYSYPDLYHISTTLRYSYNTICFAINPKYILTEEEYTGIKGFVDQKISKICAQVDLDWSDVEICLFLHDYLCSNFEYDKTYTNYDMYSMLRDKTGVCQAYYLTYRHLLNQFGITSDYAISDEMDHIWNMVKLDGEWYHMDATWDDPSPDRFGGAYHSNFLISSNRIGSLPMFTHYGWEFGPLVPEDLDEKNASGSKYDSWFWIGKTSPIVPLDGKWYFVARYSDISAAESIDSNPVVSEVYQNNSSLRTASLSKHGNELVFCTDTKIYGYTPSTESLRIIYEMETEGKYIYASAIQDGILRINLLPAGNQKDIQTVDDYHLWEDATCTEPKTCSACGETEGEALGHSWENATCTTPGTCGVCGETQGEAAGHHWNDATCTEPKTCGVCGETDGEALGHSWTDATCTTPKTCGTCGETDGEALGHSWTDATCTTSKTCGTCGETDGEALGHTWNDATCTEPKTCGTCGETDGEALGHSWTDATCTTPKTCGTCGETDGEALGHNWTDATCTTPKTCGTCGETNGEALGHSWTDATCTTSKTCGTCGETDGEALGHTWNDATCTEPKTCGVCGETDGEALGHTWNDATCTASKTCGICGETDGDALGHSWDEGSVVEAPTYTTPGKMVYTCLNDPTHTREETIPQLEAPVFDDVALILTGETEIEVSAEEASYLLSASNMTDLVSMTLTIEVDDAYFRDPEVEGLDDWTVIAAQYENGKLTVSLVCEAGANGSSDLLRLSVKPAGKAGDGSIRVSNADLQAKAGADHFPVDAVLDAAAVTTKVAYSVYDVNQDGTVSLLDMTRAQRFYGQNHPPADMNKDGTVDIEDLIMILRSFVQ